MVEGVGATDAVAGGAGVSEAMTEATVVEDAGAMTMEAAMEGAGTGATEAVAEGGGAGVALAMVEGVTCLSNSRSNCAVCSAKSLRISTRKSSVEGFMVKAGRSIQIAWIPHKSTHGPGDLWRDRWRQWLTIDQWSLSNPGTVAKPRHTLYK